MAADDGRRGALVAAWCYVQGTSGYLRMEQEDGLVASVRALLEAEPNPSFTRLSEEERFAVYEKRGGLSVCR